MRKHTSWAIAAGIICTLVAAVGAEELQPIVDSAEWTEEVDANDELGFTVSDAHQKIGCDTCGKVGCDSCSSCCPSPWSFRFTQTADYGTNLALPLTLTPANTVVAPLGNLGIANILNLNIVNQGVALVPVFQDDFQFQTIAALQRTWQIDDDSSFVAGYNFYMNRHPKAKQVDLMSHSATAQYNRRLADRLIGSLDYNYVYYLLHDLPYVSQNTGGVSFLYQYSDDWNFKLRGSYSNANFRPTPFLTSDNYAAQLEAIRYLFGGTTDYLTFGYAYGRSNARLNGFSYDLNNAFVSGRWVVGEQQRDTLQVTASYGNYAFLAADPFQIGTVRRDQILTLNGILSHQLTDRWSAFAAYTYYNSNSNVFRQIYSQHLVSLGITYNR